MDSCRYFFCGVKFDCLVHDFHDSVTEKNEQKYPNSRTDYMLNIL